MRSPLTNEPMLVLELAGVEIDYCPFTHGIWLDAGELEILFEDPEAAGRLISSFSVDESTREKKVRCPICRKKMGKIRVTDTVVIDRCPLNHGLWFDEGELIDVLKTRPEGESGKVIALLEDIFRENIRKEINK